MTFCDMGANISHSTILFDLWKLLGATLLFFLMLVVGVEQVGEPYSIIRKEYFLEQNDEEEYEHPSALLGDNFLLQELCNGVPEWCAKVVYSGTLSSYDQVKYTSQYLDIL